ncbi:hypothetical protein BgiMline_008356 [Biomphalaria glabrata]|nr:hypothetical protein BgiBS90_011542 [Biomphalaria glabrata]
MITAVFGSAESLFTLVYCHDHSSVWFTLNAIFGVNVNSLFTLVYCHVYCHDHKVVCIQVFVFSARTLSNGKHFWRLVNHLLCALCIVLALELTSGVLLSL